MADEYPFAKERLFNEVADSLQKTNQKLVESEWHSASLDDDERWFLSSYKVELDRRLGHYSTDFKHETLPFAGVFDHQEAAIEAVRLHLENYWKITGKWKPLAEKMEQCVEKYAPLEAFRAVNRDPFLTSEAYQRNETILLDDAKSIVEHASPKHVVDCLGQYLINYDTTTWDGITKQEEACLAILKDTVRPIAEAWEANGFHTGLKEADEIRLAFQEAATKSLLAKIPKEDVENVIGTLHPLLCNHGEREASWAVQDILEQAGKDKRKEQRKTRQRRKQSAR